MFADNFLLDTPQAVRLFHEVARDLPIIDYHSHLDAKAIAENRQYENIAQLWLDGDHYKWRAMRTNGVAEEFCSGTATDRAKYDAWVATVPHLLRNPLYHWTHLELRRPFGIKGILLNPGTGAAVWEQTSQQLQSGKMGARDILKMMNVELVCTTDDPCDDLTHHIAHAKAGNPDGVKLLPTFRPDKARGFMDVKAWLAWVERLEGVNGAEIHSLRDYKSALAKRHAYFVENGCRLSDHSLEWMGGDSTDDSGGAALFEATRMGSQLEREDVIILSNHLMHFFAKLDAQAGLVRQLHIGALRNPNIHALRTLGPDTGFDAIADFNCAAELGEMLNRDARAGCLPRTILYNLNPRDNEMLAVLAGSFQDGSVPGKMQYGAAWWFLDQMDGMTRHIEALSQLGMLSRFVGMLTDSRSFLSFTRHEYFRRILCRILGRDMQAGLIPDEHDMLAKMVADISYNNAKDYFQWGG